VPSPSPRSRAISLFDMPAVRRCNTSRWRGDSAALVGPFHHSITLVAAGASGFLTLTQSGERPDRYGRSRRLATMPSRPMRHACRNTIVPSGLPWSPIAECRHQHHAAGRVAVFGASATAPSADRGHQAPRAPLRATAKRRRSKLGMPSGPYATPSPSIVSERAGSADMVSTRSGTCAAQSTPQRE
jgi:hypothetical protein